MRSPALVRLALLATLAATSALAQGQGQGQAPMGPPPEALQACSGKAAGAACGFTGPQGQAASGTCFTPSADRPLACRPNNPPPGQGQSQGQSQNQGQPGAGGGNPPSRPAPPEARQACAGRATGNACNFTGPQGQALSGFCDTAPNDSQMACRPNPPPQ